MKVLIAEDDVVSCRILEDMLNDWGYEVIVTRDGSAAWKVLHEQQPPKLAIIDWLMPGMDGVEICRRLRSGDTGEPAYVILLTGKKRKEDIVTGLEAGANDFITKPFDPEELRVRTQAGRRIVELQSELAARIKELQEALDHIKILQGILPICSYCKKIRDDQSYWRRLESYLAAYADVRFSHGICPECYEKHVVPMLEELSEPAREREKR